MSILSAVILGIVQGLTEFLPVSSTGHLILTHELLGTGLAYGLAYDAVLHVATATAVVVYFHRHLWVLFQTFLRKIGRLPVNRDDEMLLYALIVGTIPAVVLGLLLEDLMETTFRSPLLVAGVLVIGSILFAYAEYVHKKGTTPRGDLGARKGLFIGLFQSLALIPGMSRSGASIAGGMILGLSRPEAARFAFLLAVPVMLGAGGKKLLELLGGEGGEASVLSLIVGAATAFIVGMFAIHFMLAFVRKYTLWPFIIYRVLLALGVVVFVAFS